MKILTIKMTVIMIKIIITVIITIIINDDNKNQNWWLYKNKIAKIKVKSEQVKEIQFGLKEGNVQKARFY